MAAPRTKRTFFVLISGKRRCGKDTVGLLLKQRVRELLAEKHADMDVVTASLADHVKRQYAVEQAIDLQRLYSDNDFKELHRPGIIALAMRERERDPAVWCKALQQECTGSSSTKDCIVLVCDHRFVAERTHFAKVLRIRVCATDVTRKTRGFVYAPDVDEHASEIELDSDTGWFARVQNDGDTLDTLRPAIEALAPRILAAYPQ